MATITLDEKQRRADALAEHATVADAARALGMKPHTLQVWQGKNADLVVRAQREQIAEPLSALYDEQPPEKTPAEAWADHETVFARRLSKFRSEDHRVKRGGPFGIHHSTDNHLDDNGTPLTLVEQDVKAAREMGLIMCHGGDALNNWPMAGRLAQQWSEQAATKNDALLRLEYYIELMAPDAWVMGNHEAMNPYLIDLIRSKLPKRCFVDDWALAFTVETPGREIRVGLSHKFQKGSSWFHKLHGHIREMLEGEPLDLLMDGHLHSDGVLDHTLPERQLAALCVASAGYKAFDKYATRISRGGKVPKLRGRAHWIICDPQAGFDANLFTAFKCPVQAETYLGGLHNLRAV